MKKISGRYPRFHKLLSCSDRFRNYLLHKRIADQENVKKEAESFFPENCHEKEFLEY